MADNLDQYMYFGEQSGLYYDKDGNLRTRSVETQLAKGGIQMIKDESMVEVLYRISIKDIYGVKHDIIINHQENTKLQNALNCEEDVKETK